jgi:hypothetical protein
MKTPFPLLAFPMAIVSLWVSIDYAIWGNPIYYWFVFGWFGLIVIMLWVEIP